MAVTITSGIVSCLQVGDDFAFVGIIDGGGINEALILWFGPSEPSAFTRIMHSMWLSLLREAMTTGEVVNLTHESSGAIVTAVQVNKT